MRTSQGSSRSIHLAVIGAQKAGTSALMDQLAGHPSINAPRDEIPVFHDTQFSKNALNSFKQMQLSDHKANCIKRPDYLIDRTAAARLRHYEGQECLVAAVVRCPAERAFAAANWYVQSRLLSPADPNSRLSSIYDALERYGALDARSELCAREYELFAHSNYSQHLVMWNQMFDRLFVFEQADVRSGNAAAHLIEELGLPEAGSLVLDKRSGGETAYTRGQQGIHRARALVSPGWENPGSFDGRPRWRKQPFRVALSQAIGFAAHATKSVYPASRRLTLDSDLKARIRQYHSSDLAYLKQSYDRVI